MVWMDKQMKWSITGEGEDAPPKRERTAQQLDAYSEMTDLLPPQTLIFPPPKSLSPTWIKANHAFPSDSTVHLIEDLEYHAAVKID